MTLSLWRRLPLLLRDLGALLFLPAIVLVVTADVLGRYFFAHPLQWTQEVATLSLLLMFVMAIPYATSTDSHIRTETLYERYPPRWRAAVDAIGFAAGAVFMGVVAGWQLYELPGLYRRGEGAEFVDIPYWPISLLVALCMGYGCLQLVARAAGAVRCAAIRGSVR